MTMKLSPTIGEADLRAMEAMQALNQATPKNEFGFPMGLYRPDLLPLHEFEPVANVSEVLCADITRPDDDGDAPLDDTDDSQELITLEQTAASPQDNSTAISTEVDRVAGFPRSSLAAAYEEIQYDEGFPALLDGAPLWSQLPYEPTDAYTCFQAYLQMPDVCEGVRLMIDLPELMVRNELLDVNGHTFRDYTPKFRIFHQIYNWQARAKAYDLFKVAAHRKQMELRSITMAESHYTKSSGLMTKLLDYMEGEDFWDMITPKVGIDMFKTLQASQRVAVGLPSTGPLTAAQTNGHAGMQPFEVILRSLAQEENNQEALTDDGSAQLQKKLTSDPKTLKLAQELVVRFGAGQTIEN